MGTAHRVRAALVAAAVVLVIVVVFGNPWYQEHVLLKDRGSAALRRVVSISAIFQWRLTPRRGAGTVWAAQIVGIVVVVGLTFLLVWLVASHASGLGLALGSVGAVAVSAAIGAFVVLVFDYRYVFADLGDPERLGRFWYSVFTGPSAASLWALIVGVLAGLAAMLAGGRAVVQHAVPVAPETWDSAGADPTTQYAAVAPATAVVPQPEWAPTPAPPPPPPADRWEQPVDPHQR